MSDEFKQQSPSPKIASPQPLSENSAVESLMGMAFNEVIKSVLDGKKVQRQAWPDSDHFVYMLKGVLTLRKSNKKDYGWILSEEDLIALDWVIADK